MKAFRVAFASMGLVGLFGSHAHAEAGSKPIMVIELFTSRSCYSCPPPKPIWANWPARKILSRLNTTLITGTGLIMAPWSLG